MNNVSVYKRKGSENYPNANGAFTSNDVETNKTSVKLISKSNFLGFEINVYGSVENPLFLAKDVAEWIDYAKTSQGYYDVSKMVNSVDEEEKHLRTIFVDSRNYEMWFLTEDGLYELLMQSRKPIAKKFKKGIKAILKEIRMTGSYSVKQQLPQTYLEALKALVVSEEEKEKLQLENNTLHGQNSTLTETVVIYEEQAKEAAPKIQYHDKHLTSKGLLTINMIASCLSISDVKLNRLLCEWGIQYKQGKTYFLYSKFRDKGYTKHIPFPYTDSNTGELKTRQHMYWTELGKKFIIELYNSKIAV